MLAGSQSALLVLYMSLMEKAFDACKEPYSEKNEKDAVEAVVAWLADAGMVLKIKTSGDVSDDDGTMGARSSQKSSLESSIASIAGVNKKEDGEIQKYENTILEVASENGYLGVVKKLLEYKDLVKFELNARVTELKQRSKHRVKYHSRRPQVLPWHLTPRPQASP